MIRHLIGSWLLSIVSLLAAPESKDLLRFTNGDQLHGTFNGVKEGGRVIWLRDDLANQGEFETQQIRQIVLRNARPLQSMKTLSNISLVNGDPVPGEITGINSETITLNTPYAGELRIPRKQVAMLSPNPLGGRLFYHGPFAEDEWKMLHPSYPDGLPAEPSEKKEAKDQAAKADNDQPGRWVFSGSSWYWQSKQQGCALIRESGMPERSVISFDLAWKNQLSLAFAFNADFAKSKGEEDEEANDAPARKKIRQFSPGDPMEMVRTFGNCNIIQIYSNYMMMARAHVDEEGKPTFQRIQMSNQNIRLDNRNHAKIEIRSNRTNGEFALYIDDEFVAQSSADAMDPNGMQVNPLPAGKGGGYGFLSLSNENTVRISEIVLSEWNGMPDAARSMQVDDEDIVLLTNGTDRFAGRVVELQTNGKIHFEGKHGKFEFPLEDVAEVRFARKQLSAAPEESTDLLKIRFHPMGSITGSLMPSEREVLELKSPILGAVKIKTDAASMLEFRSSNLLFDDWENDF